MGNRKYGKGGAGGSAEVIGSGTAIGGNGGRGGIRGPGGAGGSVCVVGDGAARGGDGGEAGRLGRPALGAVSPVAYMPDLYDLLCQIQKDQSVDRYGIPIPGRGGDSHVEIIVHEGNHFVLNTILKLLEGPLPTNACFPGIVDKVDELALSMGISTAQEWWDIAATKFPAEISAVIAYVKHCDDQHAAAK